MTKIDQPPRLGRSALLALVKLINKYHDRGMCVETDGMGTDSLKKSLSLDQSIRKNGIKKTEDNTDRESNK